MVDFDESDLVNQDYENTTTPGDDPNYTAARDRERVNKREQYEVVHFIKEFMKKHDLTQKSSFQKVEKIIRLKEASDIVMRDKLLEFVKKQWNK
ncbi:hypothetical protein [Flavobacterium sp.]|uniref:hypothetical protein n=1 Tax=Flavobacterium sp. TaxID=239 RepID=UPI00121834FC|nr:hypothetical protein [Flavobacterium sp.]RZJ71451.1 MAG: hypothetical protein EOO49_10350 [Flavobacterium sp.]